MGQASPGATVARRTGLFLGAGLIALTLSGCPSPGTSSTGTGSTGIVDLTPSSVTYSSYPTGTAQQGGTLGVTVTVQNLQAGSTSRTFTVDFYLTLNGTFSLSSDKHVGSATISGIGGNGTATGSATLNIPSTGFTDQCAYIYAVVDAAGVTGSGTTNATSTLAHAAVVLVYAPGGKEKYKFLVETYMPSGSQTTNANTWLILYVDNGSGSASPVTNGISAVSGNGIFGSLDFTVTELPSGKYYALVVASANPGSYAINVRTANISQEPVQAVLSEPSTSSDDNQPGGTNAITGSNLKTYTGPSPTNGVIITPGNAVSWYVPSGDIDWFTFTLP